MHSHRKMISASGLALGLIFLVLMLNACKSDPVTVTQTVTVPKPTTVTAGPTTSKPASSTITSSMPASTTPTATKPISTPPATTTRAVSTTPIVTSTPQPTATPKLTTLTINLAVAANNDSASYVVPVYFVKNMVLHLNWWADGGAFRMTVTTPDGAVLPMGTHGVITLSRPADKLPLAGGIAFSPADPTYFGYDWGGDGYFYFTPNLIKGDLPTKITLSYWSEIEPPKLPAS